MAETHLKNRPTALPNFPAAAGGAGSGLPGGSGRPPGPGGAGFPSAETGGWRSAPAPSSRVGTPGAERRWDNRRNLPLGLGLALFACLVLTAGPAGAAHPADEVARGLDRLARGDLEAAEAALHRARFDDPDDPRIAYDLGTVLYRKRSYGEAARAFAEGAARAGDDGLRADSLHNLGNAAYRGARFQDAVGAYEAALAIREDPHTRFNLEQAKKRLQEQLERQAQQGQQPPQGQPGQQGKQDQPGQPQQQGQSGQPGGDSRQQGQDGQQAQKPDGQQGQDGQQGKDGQDGQPKGDQQAGQPDGKDGKEGQPGDQSQAKSDPAGKNASGTPQMGNASDTAEPQEPERQDTAMARPDQEKQPPADVSQRARAMKNIKLNPYAVEKLLRDLEAREREVQQHYRNDPRRDGDEEFDPFFMTPDQLRAFMDRRTGRRAQPKSDTPDW
ncbi:MAG: tetratricopeptide repeat protein [Candidatus Riflebacteria bacterium]|nr:tetratricopeptide repeat protein [Candidatus Riflebacteria bacterium]